MADDSRTRDLLANERTFLAWLRTSANVIVLGMAIAKFADAPSNRAIAAGALLVIVGALGCIEGARRQRQVKAQIEHNELMSVPDATIPAAVLVVSLIVALLLLVI
jgi:putative membrane protein